MGCCFYKFSQSAKAICTFGGKSTKTAGVPIPRTPKRPRRGGDWKNVSYVKVVGFVFCVLPPLVSPHINGRTQRPDILKLLARKGN